MPAPASTSSKPKLGHPDPRPQPQRQTPTRHQHKPEPYPKHIVETGPGRRRHRRHPHPHDRVPAHPVVLVQALGPGRAAVDPGREQRREADEALHAHEDVRGEPEDGVRGLEVVRRRGLELVVLDEDEAGREGEEARVVERGVRVGGAGLGGGLRGGGGLQDEDRLGEEQQAGCVEELRGRRGRRSVSCWDVSGRGGGRASEGATHRVRGEQDDVLAQHFQPHVAHQRPDADLRDAGPAEDEVLPYPCGGVFLGVAVAAAGFGLAEQGLLLFAGGAALVALVGHLDVLG